VAVVGWTVLQQGYLLGARPDREDTRRMLVYCGFTAGVVALGSLTGRGDLLLLAARKGAGASAAYALAAQLAMLLAQVAMYASVLTQPRVLGLHRQSSLRRLFAVNLLVVACCTGIGAALWNPAILSGLLAGTFGSAFEASVPLLGILLLGVVFDWLIVPVLMVFGIQTCPGKVFVGELLVAIGFFALGTAAVVRPWPWPAEFIMAWIAVGGRAAKLVFYGVLFFTGTRSSQKAPLPGEP
jgi:hypothetical protein